MTTGTPRQKNTIDLIEFPGRDVQTVSRLKAFYGTVFGWSFKDWGDDYVDTASSGVGAGFNADPEHCPSHPLAVVYTTDLEAAQRSVERSGGKLTRATFEFPGGRRFHCTDPAGNELAVWSDR